MRSNINYIHLYYPVYSGLFNPVSQLILDFKNCNPESFSYFKSMTSYWIKQNLHDPYMICAVPSSKGGFVNSITRLAEKLSGDHSFLIDGSQCIVKLMTHESFCKTNKRDADLLKRSTFISDHVNGYNILLLDDITSSGTSFNVISQMLLDKGALSVTCLAMGQTVKLR
jgi:predicted amidophosphoribosyltransferase